MKVENTQKDYPQVPNIVMLVYGMGGVGKTTFAATFPRPLILDFENGAKYFKQRGIDVDVVRIDKWFSADDKKGLAKLMENYDSLIFDPIGEMMEKLIHSDQVSGSKYRQSDGSLTIAGWGKVKDHARSTLKWARDLGKNVLLVAHVDEKMDEETMVKRPQIATKIGDEIIAMVDIVGYLDIITVDGVEKRVVRVNPTDKRYIAKDRTGALEAYVKPEFDYMHSLIKKAQKVTKKDTSKKDAPKSNKKATTKKDK
jgi:hypothetical protein